MQKVKQVDETQETVTIRAVSVNEEGRKRVEKTEVHTHNPETLKHIEKKLIDKGLLRMDRHPRDGIPLDKQSKGGRGGKYTWDGPGGMIFDELDPAPAAVDENDPNYVSEEVEAEPEKVVGQVEVAKVANQGVARVDVGPRLKLVE